MAIGRTNAGGGGFNKSVIIVTAPTGSTVTCTKGTTVKTATEKNGEWWFKGLDTGTWKLKATLSGQTATQTVNITQFDVYRVSLVYRLTPEFTYANGTYKIVDDSDSAISDFPNYKGNWKIRFLTSGTFKVTNMHGWDGRIDLFLVGGGGGGGKVYDSSRGEYEGGGGGGGYTSTRKSVQLSLNTGYPITIGSGGAISTDGGNTSAFGYSASGGKKATKIGGDGGSGGGSSGYATGGNGGSNGSDGTTTDNQGGKGQGTTTKEFGESSRNLYAGGGGGGVNQKVGGYVAGKGGDGGGADATKSAVDNTGGGGGGSNVYGELGGSGGSGIVIIRNAR